MQHSVCKLMSIKYITSCSMDPKYKMTQAHRQGRTNSTMEESITGPLALRAAVMNHLENQLIIQITACVETFSAKNLCKLT
jgi:CRISPR/Cas system type I-B associated protein Csh2 (Cas7 group RAMP superfamily)